MFDGVHQTDGVDVYVTSDRTILLDSQVLVDMRHICVIDTALYYHDRSPDFL